MADASAVAALPSATASPLELCLRLSHAQAILTRRLDNGLASLHGLSFGDFTILYHLSRAPGLKLRRIDLAERVGLTASGVTRSLLPLEKLGLVGRESDPRDARVAHALLTKAGQRLLGHALTTAEQISGELTRVASAEQVGVCVALLGQLAGRPLSHGEGSALASGSV